MHKHTVSNNVFTFYVKIKQLGNKKRKIWVYLPPDYHNSNKRYPVLYMHDGQNLFDEYTSYCGEWKIDKTLNSLFERKKNKGVIIVGIENGEMHRTDEYSPWKSTFKKLATKEGGKGDSYSDFIVEDLKPQIDKLYRTLSDRKNTGVAGSSLGAYISIYMAFKYPEVFSKVGAFSSAFFFAKKEIYKFLEKAKLKYKLKIYMDVGTKEGQFKKQYVECSNNVHKLFEKNKKITHKYVIDKGGVHNEKDWAKRFPEAFLWLFSK